MIALVKGPSPSVLLRHSKQWLTDLMIALASKDVRGVKRARDKYRDTEVKSFVIRDSNGKCSYCESLILHIDYGHIDHIMPKSKFPELTFDWSNLMLLCTRCNVNKGDYYDPSLELINPYRDEPSSHFTFHEHLIRAASGDDRALKTLETIDLNRVELQEVRKEHLQRLARLSQIWKSSNDNDIKALAQDQLAIEAESAKPYSAYTKSYLRSMGISV